MPHIYREVSLYGLHNDWIVTQTPGGKEDYFTATMGSEQRNLSHDQEVCTRLCQVWLQSMRESTLTYTQYNRPISAVESSAFSVTSTETI
jgi:hypothetical protein